MVSSRWGVGLGRSHGQRRERQTRVGSLYARITSLKHYGLVLVSRSVSTWEFYQDHFAECALRDRLQGSDGISCIGPPSLSGSMARRPQTLCRVHAASLGVSHDRSSSCLTRPISVVQSCDTVGRSVGGVRATMISSICNIAPPRMLGKDKRYKGSKLHLPQDFTPRGNV